MPSRKEIEQEAQGAVAKLSAEWPPEPDVDGQTYRCLTCAARIAFESWPVAKMHFIAIHQVSFPVMATLELVWHLRGRGFSDHIQRGTFPGGVQFTRRSRIARRR